MKIELEAHEIALMFRQVDILSQAYQNAAQIIELKNRVQAQIIAQTNEEKKGTP